MTTNHLTPWTIRTFDYADLEPAVRLWESWGNVSHAPTLSLADLVNALSEAVPAVVADLDGELVGAAFARISGQRGWVQRLVIAEPWRNRGIGRALLDGLERRLEELGVDRLVAVIPADTARLFESAGWQLNAEVIFAEKDASSVGAHERLLRLLGGSRPSPSLWDPALGSSTAAGVIQRRVIEPLLNPAITETLGLRVPGAVLLFGPPGTGKTTFAHAIAGRLGWSLVEWRRPISGDSSDAQEMARFFDSASHLDNVVLFIDEVEEFAASRSEQTTGSANSGTNELLKALSKFRSRAGRLLVASTNHVGRLDPAILRPGRFDLVIPVGVPGAQVRRLMIQQRLQTMSHAVLSLDDVVQRTEGFTAADLAHLFDKACQMAFREALAGAPAVLTDAHVNESLAAATRTLDDADMERFEVEVERFGRT